ncbi:MAG: SusE domain-containing protein [Flavobacterium sp.]|uniref:SusE domain-containing protein n=1 Tax=Flavobacterium sp. TaxID=239 RepID=UPI00326538BF
MKNSLRLLIAFISIGAISCTDDVQDRESVSENAAPVLKSPTTLNLVLNHDFPNDLATTVVWDYAAYNGTQTVVNYSIEFAEAGTNFASPTVVATTTNKFKTFTVGELNTAALDAGLAPFVSSAVDVRIKSTVGSLGSMAQASNFVTLNLTPYPAWPNWGIIGSATPTGWDSDTNMDYSLSSHLYSITMPLIGGQAFKFRLDDGWSVNFGDNGNDLTLEGNGADIPVAVSGTYLIVANFSTSSVGGMAPTSYTITLQ